MIGVSTFLLEGKEKTLKCEGIVAGQRLVVACGQMTVSNSAPKSKYSRVFTSKVISLTSKGRLVSF